MSEKQNARTKPLVIFDGDCGFCRLWITRWQAYTEDRVDYAPYQEVHDQFPEIPVDSFRSSVKLIEPDGKVHSAAKAAFVTLAYNPSKRWLYWLYSRVPGFAPISEWIYKFVASHRRMAFRMTRFFYGQQMEPSTYRFSQWLFVRSLAVIYFFAFFSLWMQLPGLVGKDGILPAHIFLEYVKQHYGPERYALLPSLFWISSSDVFFQVLCATGIAFSILLFFGILPGLLLFLEWALYLSLVSVCRDFLSFQWDVLLLETGFLAIFLTSFFARNTRRSNPNKYIRWLLKWLLFRLMVSSGMVKLLSHDPTWHNLTALNFHYWTQPLPTWIGWYANLLPEWFQKFSVALMFVIEIAVPFLIFAPRRLRHLACWTLIGFQCLIFLTGNYCFFNLLAIALCLLLLDDAFWRKQEHSQNTTAASVTPTTQSVLKSGSTISAWVILPVSLVLFLLSMLHFSETLGLWTNWPAPLTKLYVWCEPFRSVNGYGLFARMTTQRDEIIIEGSNDGSNWMPYEFKYKPGDLKHHPEFIEPMQPRLDWQMWFAALDSYERTGWFLPFCFRVLQGSKPVLALLEKNPFPEKPPRLLRAMLYEYRFSDWSAHRADGSWWQRKPKRLYCPVLAVRQTPEGFELYNPR